MKNKSSNNNSRPARSSSFNYHLLLILSILSLVSSMGRFVKSFEKLHFNTPEKVRTMGLWNKGKTVEINDSNLWMKHMVRNKLDVEKFLSNNGFKFHTLTHDKFWTERQISEGLKWPEEFQPVMYTTNRLFYDYKIKSDISRKRLDGGKYSFIAMPFNKRVTQDAIADITGIEPDRMGEGLDASLKLNLQCYNSTLNFFSLLNVARGREVNLYIDKEVAESKWISQKPMEFGYQTVIGFKDGVQKIIEMANNKTEVYGQGPKINLEIIEID